MKERMKERKKERKAFALHCIACMRVCVPEPQIGIGIEEKRKLLGGTCIYIL